MNCCDSIGKRKSLEQRLVEIVLPEGRDDDIPELLHEQFLPGIVTFSLQGIRPATWWQKSKAGKAKRRALIVWITLLVLPAFFCSISNVYGNRLSHRSAVQCNVFDSHAAQAAGGGYTAIDMTQTNPLFF